LMRLRCERCGKHWLLDFLIAVIRRDVAFRDRCTGCCKRRR
jgi:hypothetical protein